MLKNKKGITLIALVVTIVVLLILAGVTISLLLDENGIIAKSKDARTETRVSQIEDEVGMWKQHNFINKESNQAQESADTMLASLISRKLLTEDEIDREQELITIKKKDGTIVKEISYGNVTINISKTPATDKSRAVVLTATATGTIIPNIDMSNGNQEFNNWVNSLSEDQKKEIIRYGYIKMVNEEDPSANCTTFQDVLDWAKEQGDISEATEDAFWTGVASNVEGGIDGATSFIIGKLYYNESTKMIEGYTVTNPANETSNKYIATENGTYTFKVQDVITGKTYTKKVEVTNVDTTMPLYIITTEKNNVGNIRMYLTSVIDNKKTTFEAAYVIYNGERVDMTEKIYTVDYSDGTSISEIITNYACKILLNAGKITNTEEVVGTVQKFILVKDGKEYTGEAIMEQGKKL
ncbi:MAG: type II secretion system protein [Clostridia bacterium]